MAARADNFPTAGAEHVVVKPLAVHIGAESEAIRPSLLRWKVVFFRDQYRDHRQHIDFVRQFGEPVTSLR